MKNKILVIEDNEQNLYLMTFILENNGYEVVQTQAALAISQNQSIPKPS